MQGNVQVRSEQPGANNRCSGGSPAGDIDPGYTSRKIRKFGTDKFDGATKMMVLTHLAHVNGWKLAVYMSCMSENFRLFHASNLSVLNFRFFSAHVSGLIAAAAERSWQR